MKYIYCNSKMEDRGDLYICNKCNSAMEKEDEYRNY